MKERSTRSRIPEFQSVEEEAAFWDTHDTTEFEEEFTPVKVRFAKNLSHGLTIRLDPETLEKLREEAHAKGIGPTTLVRMWVMEQLRETRQQPYSAQQGHRSDLAVGNGEGTGEEVTDDGEKKSSEE